MEDFEFTGKMYKAVEVKRNRCDGCSFERCPISICYKLPDCNTVPYIFVETSQNALQQEQEASS